MHTQSWNLPKHRLYPKPGRFGYKPNLPIRQGHGELSQQLMFPIWQQPDGAQFHQKPLFDILLVAFLVSKGCAGIPRRTLTGDDVRQRLRRRLLRTEPWRRRRDAWPLVHGRKGKSLRKHFSVCPHRCSCFATSLGNLCGVNLALIGWWQSGKMSWSDVVGVSFMPLRMEVKP